MKKQILALAVLALAVACNKDQVVDKITPEAIQFSDVFVENATRAAYDGTYNHSRLKTFEVYGTITNTAGESANIFNQETVTKSTVENATVWGYDVNNTQYWLPGNTYNFTAIADGNIDYVTKVTTGQYSMPATIELYDASQQKDILYVKNEPYTYTSGEHTVGFTFNHLMSKAKITVKNTITTDNGYSYKVKDVKITNAAKAATYTVGTGWGASSDYYTLDFGHIVESSVDANNSPITAEAVEINYNESYESNFERLLIPTNVAEGSKTNLTVECTCELYKDDVLIQTTRQPLSTETVLLAGHAYNFSISLGNPGSPIKFTVINVNTWDTTNGDVTVR